MWAIHFWQGLPGRYCGYLVCTRLVKSPPSSRIMLRGSPLGKTRDWKRKEIYRRERVTGYRGSNVIKSRHGQMCKIHNCFLNTIILKINRHSLRQQDTPLDKHWGYPVPGLNKQKITFKTMCFANDIMPNGAKWAMHAEGVTDYHYQTCLVWNPGATDRYVDHSLWLHTFMWSYLRTSCHFNGSSALP